MVVAVTGAQGLVGSALSAFLTTGGHRVIRLVRRPARHGRAAVGPDAAAPDLLVGCRRRGAPGRARRSPGGSPIATRPRSATAASSRRAGSPKRRPDRRRARGLRQCSAIGNYGYDRGDALLCEESVRGDGFLADVVADWEAATGPAA